MGVDPKSRRVGRLVDECTEGGRVAMQPDFGVQLTNQTTGQLRPFPLFNAPQ